MTKSTTTKIMIGNRIDWGNELTNSKIGHKNQLPAGAIASEDVGFGEWFVTVEGLKLHQPILSAADMALIIDEWTECTQLRESLFFSEVARQNARALDIFGDPTAPYSSEPRPLDKDALLDAVYTVRVATQSPAIRVTVDPTPPDPTTQATNYINPAYIFTGKPLGTPGTPMTPGIPAGLPVSGAPTPEPPKPMARFVIFSDQLVPMGEHEVVDKFERLKIHRGKLLTPDGESEPLFVEEVVSFGFGEPTSMMHRFYVRPQGTHIDRTIEVRYAVSYNQEWLDSITPAERTAKHASCARNAVWRAEDQVHEMLSERAKSKQSLRNSQVGVGRYRKP